MPWGHETSADGALPAFAKRPTRKQSRHRQFVNSGPAVAFMNKSFDQPAQTAPGNSPGVPPDDARARNFDAQPGIVLGQNQYYAQRSGKDGAQPPPVQISNFVMNVVRTERFIDQSDPVVRRTVRLTADTGYSVETTANPEEICNKNAFRKFILSKGNFHFYGSDADVERIIALTFKADGREINAKHIAGLEPDTGHWIFQNGCVGSDGKIYRPDSAGVVAIGGKSYKLEHSDLDGKAVRAPKLCFDSTVNGDDLLRSVMLNTGTLWGPQTELAWGWMLAALWRTNWLAEAGNFPLLFIAGPRALGKNTFMRIAMRLYGVESNPISLNGLTDTSIYTVNNRFCNIPVWLDEFKNDIKVTVREALKGNYDGSDQVRGTLDQFVTKTRRHRTGMVITGESRPDDSALDSRSVTPALVQQANYELLRETELQAKGLSTFLVMLLPKVRSVWTPIYDGYRVLYEGWKQKGALQSRACENYAKACATLNVLLPDAARQGRFREWLVQRVEMNAETNIIAEMLRSLPYLVQVRKLDVPYRVEAGSRRLHVCAAFLVNAYCDQNREQRKPKTDELIRLGKDGGLLIPSHTDKPMKAYVDENTDGQKTKVQQRCFIFDGTNPIVAEVIEGLQPEGR